MINRLTIKGFQSHNDTEIKLSSGVNVLVGNTNAGKSAVLRALQWIVFNRPSGTRFVNAGVGECFVEVETDRGTARRCRTPFNGYQIGGTDYKTVGTTVPEELKDVIKLDELNFQTQLRGQFFLVLDTPGKISRTVSELLGFEVVDKFVTKGKTMVSEANSRHARLDDDVCKFTTLVNSLEGLDQLHGELRVVETMSIRVEQIHDMALVLSQLSIQAEKVSHLIEKADGFLVDTDLASVNTIFKKLETLETEVEGLDSLVDSLSSVMKEIQGHTDDLNGCCRKYGEVKKEYINHLRKAGICPYCFTEIDQPTLDKIVSSI